MTNSTRTRIGAAGLVLGPLLFTLGDLIRRLIEPAGPTSAVAITAAVGRHPAAWAAAGLLSAAAGICLVPGAVALIVSARARGARATALGAGMLGVGAVAAVGHAVAFYTPYALYHQAHLTRPTLTHMDRAAESYPLSLAVIVLFILGMVLGPIVLFIGLRRARRVPIYSLIAALVFVTTGSTSSPAAGLVGLLAALIAFVPAAHSLTTTTTTSASSKAATTLQAEPVHD